MSGKGVPQIAIVVPCYQSARYVAETVASVQAQTVADWRLVVVDDGSTDNPAAALATILEQDDRVRLIRQENAGVAAARNAGARDVGPSRFILFLDADDVLEPLMLERMADELNAHPEAGMAHCRPSFIDEAGAPAMIRWAPRLEPRGFSVGVLAEEVPVTPFVSVFCLAGIVPSLALIRRELFDATPGWDEDFGQHYEDTLFFLQIALKAPVRYVADPLVRHRRHSGQSTSDTAKFDAQERKLYERFRDTRRLSAREAAIVRDAWRFRERRLIPMRAAKSARASLRRRELGTAARFIAGAARIWAVSMTRGPARARI